MGGNKSSRSISCGDLVGTTAPRKFVWKIKKRIYVINNIFLQAMNLYEKLNPKIVAFTTQLSWSTVFYFFFKLSCNCRSFRIYFFIEVYPQE